MNSVNSANSEGRSEEGEAEHKEEEEEEEEGTRYANAFGAFSEHRGKRCGRLHTSLYIIHITYSMYVYALYYIIYPNFVCRKCLIS